MILPAIARPRPRAAPPLVLREMVIPPTIVTMSRRSDRWSVASAKAELSLLVESAQHRPQVIERRGKPVAVVMAIEQFEDRGARARWRKFLAASAELRAQGGGELPIPPRRRRRSPFGRS